MYFSKSYLVQKPMDGPKVSIFLNPWWSTWARRNPQLLGRRRVGKEVKNRKLLPPECGVTWKLIELVLIWNFGTKWIRSKTSFRFDPFFAWCHVVRLWNIFKFDSFRVEILITKVSFLYFHRGATKPSERRSRMSIIFAFRTTQRNVLNPMVREILFDCNGELFYLMFFSY